MKRLLFLLLVCSSISFAQSRYTDSTFTATTAWKLINLQDANTKRVEIFDSSAVNIRFATLPADTGVGRTKYQPIVYGGTAFTLPVFNGQYLYVKSISGTAIVSVRTY